MAEEKAVKEAKEKKLVDMADRRDSKPHNPCRDMNSLCVASVSGKAGHA